MPDIYLVKLLPKNLSGLDNYMNFYTGTLKKYFSLTGESLYVSNQGFYYVKN